MKRRRIEPTPAPQVVTPPRLTLVQRLPGWVVPLVLTAMLAVGMFLPTGRVSMILTFVSLALLLVLCRSAAVNLSERVSLPVVGFLAFVLSTGAAAIYAPSGTYAYSEFVKLLAALPLALLALALVERRSLRGAFWGFAVVVAFVSLVNVDTASTGWLYKGFATVMDALGADFSTLDQTATTRINGIYNDANVTASLSALGGLVGVWLARSGEKRREKLLACFLMGLCAMGFFLSLSRGAILCFGVAVVVYVIAAGKEDRLSLGVFLGETAVVTVLLSAVSMGFLGDQGSPIPDLLTLVCGPLVYLLDRFLGARLTGLFSRLRRHGKAVLVACLAVVVIGGAAIFALSRVTGPYTFGDTGYLDRVLVLDPGDYTLSGDWDGGEDITVVVFSRSRNQVLMSQESYLYNGVLADAQFTVPEDAVKVYFRFFGSTGSTIRTVTLSDGRSIPMNYKYIPEMLVSRLQGGLLSSNSYLLRAQFMKDGLALFARRPLLGYGLGGTQAWALSVMPFYYESKYVHNQMIQVMAEQGLVGLAAWLCLMLGTAWLLLRRLRQDRDPLAAMLLACWIMMNLHSLMEINFNIRGYQVAVYFLLALTMTAFPRPLFSGVRGQRRSGWLALVLMAGWMAFFGVTFEMSRISQKVEIAYESNSQVMRDIQKTIKMDLYDPEEMELNYVANAAALDSSKYNYQMQKYVQKLRKSGTYNACSGVGQYYYLPKGDLENVFACSREGIENWKALRDSWNLEFIYYFETVLPEIEVEQFPEFVEGVNATRTMLAEYESTHMEKIDIAILAQTYLDAFDAVADMDSAEAYAQLLLVVQENQ